MPNLKMPQINTLTISGRLTRDPDTKNLTDGKIVCNLGLATDIGWGDKKKTLFLDCTCWGKTAEIAGKLSKSSPVVLEGYLGQDEWNDKDTGAKRSKITMTATRVHGLEWDGEKPEQSEQGITGATPFG